ncbi:aldo/keto reductase [Saliphagus sp. LR7]|uniref:aldo/keto reductase n=1 Tax=Saliphagus sp. LR7 TaxID=2282654 RepID=UPI000DF840AF|nr:aldo/keto reductase [Saliphagus sp. LR7]
MDQIPPIGLGTWEHTDRKDCIESVRLALEMGYQHVDTAQVYGTEEYVREGIREASVDRDEIFLATKVHEDDPGLGYENFYEAARNRLSALGVDYLDLLYIHWPLGSYEAEETLPELDRVIDDGIAKHVGLSNFTPELIQEARETLENPLFAHQLEMHPFLQQDEQLEYAQRHGHSLVAYSPLARGQVFESEVLTDIAAKHGVSAAQVSLAWLLSRENVVVIPKATGSDHLRDNWEAQNLELDDEDIERIGDIDRTERFVNREDAPWR